MEIRAIFVAGIKYIIYITRMKKIITVCLLGIFSTNAYADYNPFTGTHSNQLSIFIGQGVDSAYIVPPPARFVPFNIMHLQYSQPTTFFKLPARQSLNIAQTVGFAKKYGWNWPSYSIPIAFISGDVALLDLGCWYFAAGVGVGLQAYQNERSGAKLLFQLKLSAGRHITDALGVEFFVQHFSNANTAPENYSYGFYGAGITYSF